VLEPAVQALAEDGHEYRGVLYAGLMLTAEGPRCLEFNARFGDPETQVVLPRLRSDLVELMLGCARGELEAATHLDWDPRPSVGIVVASGGYPDAYETGFPIVGLTNLPPGVMVFHAGTRFTAHDGLVTAGGRVLTCVGLGDTVDEARLVALSGAVRVGFPGAYFRRDIAQEAI
jgi:phosphoribosylamine---glycine ligase